MLRYEIVSTSFFFILGIGVALSAWKIGFGKWEDPGAGFMGVLSGSVLAALSLLWLIFSWVKRPANGPPAVQFFPERRSLTRILKVLIPLCCYPLFFEQLGFLICTIIFLSILFKEDSKSWIYTLILSLTVSFLTFIVFQLWLQIQFPEGLVPIYRIKKWIF